MAPGGFDPRPATELVKPLKPPPYLASDSMNRATLPADPWGETIKTLLLVYGVLLIACFVAPWSVGAQTTFSWTALKAPGFAAKLLPLFIVSTGALAIVLGAIPIGSTARGLATALVGATPMLMIPSVPKFEWRLFVSVIALVMMVGGLLVRSRYTQSSLGRIIATIGVVIVLALYLIPQGGELGLVATFKALGSQPVQPAAIIGIGFAGYGLVPLVLTALTLLVWLPGPGSGGATALAWLLILAGILTSIVTLLMGKNIGETLKMTLFATIYIPVAMSAWLAFAGYGSAMVVGKKLEAG